MKNKLLLPLVLCLLWSAIAEAQTRFESLNFLRSIEGQYVVSGQHNDQKNLECGLGSGPSGPKHWTDQVHNITGKYPGLWGGDLLFHGSAQLRWDMTYEAERQWNSGAIVNIMWHACPPTQGASCQWSGGLLSSMNAQEWAELLTDGSNLNNTWKARVNEIAVHLQYLEDAGVEVFWRPYHEQNQSAFWWNSAGPENTKALWRMMHNYMTNDLGLTNLIWVWDIQDLGTGYWQWNPGAEYFDVMALDIYSDGYSNASYYNDMVANAGDKPIAIGECFELPSAQDLNNYPKYSFFMNWAYGLKKKWAPGCENTNTDDYIRQVYNNPKVLTLDEMPGWGNGVTTNLATNKPVFVSSSEAGENVKERAVDGNLGTRWSSAYNDDEWLYVDLENEYNIDNVTINWEAAYASSYEIQISNDAQNWTTVKTITGNTTLLNAHDDINATTRYIRIQGNTRATIYGYSIFELEVTGSLNATAYNGTPATIPGTIEAEEYDLGGEGVAYNDLSVGNSFNVFRTDDADVESIPSGGFNIGNFQTGEWLNYQVDVAQSGNYDFNFKVASTSTTGAFHIELDGNDITGVVAVPATGGWHTFSTVSIPNIALTEGAHELRLVCTGQYFNIDNMEVVVPVTLDCNGDPNGTAFLDNCNTCVGGSTGIVACTQDCNNDWGGTAALDDCNICAGGNTGVTACVPGPQPYNGSPITIPGLFEAEHYDLGGQDLAYHDNSTGNEWNNFRTDDVDIEISGSGFNIGAMDAGEWLNYTIDVAATGNYIIQLSVASEQTSGRFHIEMDGQDITGAIDVPNTGGWQTFTSLALPAVNMTAGTHQFQIHVDGTWANIDNVQIDKEVIILDCNGDANGSAYLDNCNTCVAGNTGLAPCTQDCNNEWGGTATIDGCETCVGGSTGLQACLHAPYNGARASIPGTIQVEEYDLGGEGLGYHDITLGNQFNVFRADDVDVEAIPSGGYNLGEIAAGEWTNYLVNVTESDDYQFTFSVASQTTGGSFYITIDGQNVTGTVNVGNTGGWHTFSDVSVNSIPLSAGNHSLRLIATGPLFNIDAMSIEKQGVVPPSNDDFRVVGYLPTWANFPNSIYNVDLSIITHIDIAFSNPDWNGNIGVPNGTSTIVNTCHAQNVKVLLSICGATGDAATYGNILSDGGRTDYFVANLVQLCLTHNMDGIDVDIEGNVLNGFNVNAAQYEAFVIKLRNALHAQGLDMTAALGGWFMNDVTTTAARAFDFIGMMSYDAHGTWSGPGQHSPYSLAVSDFNNWRAKGVDADKLVVGVPFYGYGWGSNAGAWSYADILNSYPGSEYQDQVSSGINTIYYNGIPTIQQKTAFAQANAGGVMIWELTQDVSGDRSLLKAIGDQMNSSPVADVTGFEVEENEAVEVYPNPSLGGDVHITAESGNSDEATLLVFNSGAEQVLSIPLTAENGSYNYVIPSGELVQGVYVIKVVSDHHVSTQTMVIY